MSVYHDASVPNDAHFVKDELMKTYDNILFADSKESDFRRENANIDTDAPMGIMLKLGAEGSKKFVDDIVLPKEFREADKENWIHIHEFNRGVAM